MYRSFNSYREDRSLSDFDQKLTSLCWGIARSGLTVEQFVAERVVPAIIESETADPHELMDRLLVEAGGRIPLPMAPQARPLPVLPNQPGGTKPIPDWMKGDGSNSVTSPVSVGPATSVTGGAGVPPGMDGKAPVPDWAKGATAVTSPLSGGPATSVTGGAGVPPGPGGNAGGAPQQNLASEKIQKQAAQVVDMLKSKFGTAVHQFIKQMTDKYGLQQNNPVAWKLTQVFNGYIQKAIANFKPVAVKGNTSSWKDQFQQNQQAYQGGAEKRQDRAAPRYPAS